MQITLQEKYRDKWEKISPETGKNKLLWMISEIGEVIDIIKKHGCQAAEPENSERGHLIEELLLIVEKCGNPGGIVWTVRLKLSGS